MKEAGKIQHPQAGMVYTWTGIRLVTQLPLLGLESKPLLNLHPSPSFNHSSYVHTPEYTPTNPNNLHFCLNSRKL